MNKSLMMAFVVTIASVVHAEFVTDLSKGWRLTVGPQFNFNASGRMGVKRGAIPRPGSSWSDRAAAQAAGNSISLGGGRTDFPNGAFVDPSDAAGAAGETWNWHVPAGALNDGKMTFANGYTEQMTTYESIGGGARDDSWSAGVAFGLDRLVWQSGDFGVEVGFNFSFFMKDNWYKGASGGYRRTDTTSSGAYMTDVDMGNADVMSDPWVRNPDGSYGAGTFDGPGPVISTDDISINHYWEKETSQSSTTAVGPFQVRGDLQMYEFQMILRPYYELTDWFVVRGALGLGLDYRKFDVKVNGYGGGSDHDWDCYMVCGLGGLAHYENVCLGVDFLRKVFDDEFNVDTRYVDGTIRNAGWSLRFYIGYEF